MDIRIKKWLIDIKFAIEEIESFFENKPKDFLEYKKNLMLKRAIERNLEIIGEATNRIYKHESDIQIENAKSIIGLRNLIIHSYDNISDENIWAIIINHIPKLKKEINKIINILKLELPNK